MRGDAAIDDVLRLVDATHPRSASADPARLLEAALAAARASHPEAPAPALGSGSTLTATLAPALATLLDACEPEDGPARRDLRARLLDAALRSLDRWSSASTGRARSDQQARRSGELAGIGVRVGRRQGELRVIGVVPGSGAELAGLRPGDVVLGVDGERVDGFSVSDLLARLRGAAGTRVLVATENAWHDVERRVLEQPSVARKRHGACGILRIRHFSRRTPAECDAAWRRLREEGCTALLLDLRGNTGGSMLGAAGVADLFVGHGVLAEALDASERPVAGLKARVDATPGGDLETPLGVLVDRRTASSAELLAAALSWNGRAVLLGERTFGKIVVGKPHAFDDADLTVVITSATMRAAGRELPSEGLEPGVALDLAAKDVVAQACHAVLRRVHA